MTSERNSFRHVRDLPIIGKELEIIWEMLAKYSEIWR
jgi:hypothetical protein